eukprot:761361-Hanusia_phi.AAC.9
MPCLVRAGVVSSWTSPPSCSACLSVYEMSQIFSLRLDSAHGHEGELSMVIPVLDSFPDFPLPKRSDRRPRIAELDQLRAAAEMRPDPRGA